MSSHASGTSRRAWLFRAAGLFILSLTLRPIGLQLWRVTLKWQIVVWLERFATIAGLMFWVALGFAYANKLREIWARRPKFLVMSQIRDWLGRG